jgi:hypothetical protein
MISDLTIHVKNILMANIAKAKTVPKTEQREKNPAAVALAKLGASKGGLARAKKLSARRRKQIASKAAKTRWANADGA